MQVDAGIDNGVVEVVMPVFLTDNALAQTWLDEAIASVFAQTYPSWHLTIVDDASPVSALPVLEKWIKAHPRKCSIIKRGVQGGAATARMDAVVHSNAEYLAFLDQDDIFEPDKLAKQVARLEDAPSIAAVHTDINIIDASGLVQASAAQRENDARAAIDYEALDNQQLATSIFNRNSIRIISGMFRLSEFQEVGGYDTSLNGGEDWELWVRFCDKYKLGYVNFPLLRRRVHTGNVSANHRIQRLHGQLDATYKMAKRYPYLAEHVPAKIASIESRIARTQAQVA